MGGGVHHLGDGQLRLGGRGHPASRRAGAPRAPVPGRGGRRPPGVGLHGQGTLRVVESISAEPANGRQIVAEEPGRVGAQRVHAGPGASRAP
jgi:hypothetical protein